LGKSIQSTASRLRVITFGAAIIFVFLPGLLLAASDTPGFRVQLPGANHKGYTLTAAEDLSRLKQDLEQLIRSEEEFLARRKADQKKQRAETPLAEMSRAQLQRYHSEPLGLPTGNELRALRELQSLARELEAAASPETRTNTMRLMMETARSIENLHRSPIPTRMDIEVMPFIFLGYLSRPVAKGDTLAANVLPACSEPDPSRIDPPDSTFWKKPAAIAQASLFHCFGRDEWPDYSEIVWEYSEPKTSFGTNPGFKLKHGDMELKAKFGEQHSEPFNVRIFHALGFNAEQTDYARSLRIKYDRRLFREFNLHKELKLRFYALGLIPGGYVSVQRYHDPFQFITGAVLKDGARLTGAELKRRLLREPEQAHAGEDAASFDAAFESQIEYLITCPANVQFREPGVQNLGPWEFGGLGHENLRELRGVALLGAWLGWVDVRFDNTRLKLVGSGDAVEVKHYFSDLGGGAGKGVGLFSWHPERPNLFEWTFTKPRRVQGRGRMTIPFRIVNYRPVDVAPAFEEMTWDDARWMARLIGQLTEEQIVQGLVASGWGSAEVRLLTEKLVNRRDQMIRDLELTGEVPLLRPGGIIKSFSYDPVAEGAVTIVLSTGEKISAPVTGAKVVEGRLVKSAAGRPVSSSPN